MTSESTEPFIESSTMHPTIDSSNVARSLNQRHSPSLRKVRKLSRVFTEFSLLDPFASRKNVDNPETPPHNAAFIAHGHIHTRTISLEASSKKSLDGTPSLPTSSISQLPAREIGADTIPHDNKLISKSNSETVEELPQLLTPSTSQIRPPKLPEIPPPSSSSRHNSILVKKQRKSLNLRRTNGSQLPARSSSLRVSDMRRPATHNRWPDSPPDIRELPVLPEAYNHYLEVKRARKMTQLFGQELPPELIRAPDKGPKTEYSRHRRDSSSSLDSAHSTLEADDKSSLEEDITDISSPKLPHAEFQERRRRITKLTQFFGVSHSEIASSVVSANSVVSAKPDDKSTLSLDAEPQGYASAATVEHEVGVKIVSRRRWGLGEDMRDVELSDAITRLRGLKST